MSVKHKYVRHSLLGFVLWPHSDDLWHLHIAQLLERRVSTQSGGHVVSAGFAFIGPLTVVCNGESESLGIASRPDDSLALARQLGRVTTADQVAPTTEALLATAQEWRDRYSRPERKAP